MPRRARYLVPRGLPRRDEILAVCVVLAVLVHLLFAQLTIILAAMFYLVTKLTRWSLSWLVIPAAAGLAWTATGAGAAVAGYTAGAARIASYLGERGHQAGHLLHFTGAYAGIGTWLPRQLPLALVAGAVEAALAGWLSWLHTDEQDLRPVRPGLIVAARRAATIHAIRSGRVVARDGGCLGVTAGSGTRITLSWAEASGSVAVCGAVAADVLTTGFQLVYAAVRQRKPVFAVDHTGDPALVGQLAAVCAAAGATLLVFGGAGELAGAGGPAAAGAARARAACYEPFRHGSPGPGRPPSPGSAISYRNCASRRSAAGCARRPTARRPTSASAARSPTAPWCSSGSAARSRPIARRCLPAWSARTCWPPDRPGTGPARTAAGSSGWPSAPPCHASRSPT